MSIRIKMVAVVATLLLLTGAQSQAGFIGTLGFVDIGSPTANTGNINTATSFTLGNFLSTVGTGALAGLPSQSFGSPTFSTSGSIPFSITSASFGTFTSTSIVLLSSGVGTISFGFLGNWTPGTYVGGGATTAASLTISFTQTPANTGQIGDSATFSVPPAFSVPEPASIAMVVMGLGGVFAVRRYRRRAA
jgi:hypothetical protein